MNNETNYISSEDILSTTKTQLFNIHEKWGIFIAFSLFILGFPSNLLSIIVCLKTLLPSNSNKFFEIFRKFSKKSSTLNENLKTQMVDTAEQDGEESMNKNKKLTKVQMNLPRGKLTTYNQTINPHRKCFELYLIEISICDLIILSYSFIEWLLLILSRFDIIDKIYSEPTLISKFMCKFLIAFNRTIFHLHNWLVALLAVTRCYAIYRPFNKHAFTNSNFYLNLNLYNLLFLLIIFMTSNVFVSVFIFDLTQTSHNLTNQTVYVTHCSIKEELKNRFYHIEVVHNLVVGVIGYSLPTIITLIINIALIANLKYLLQNRSKENSLRRNTRNLFDDVDKSDSYLNRVKFLKTSSSLLLISFSYLICYIPFTTFYMLLSLDKIDMRNSFNSNLVYSLTLLRYLNHTLNFFIYYATAKRFRNDVNSFIKFRK